MSSEKRKRGGKNGRKLLGLHRNRYDAHYFGLPIGVVGEAALCVRLINQAAVDMLRGHDAARWLQGQSPSEAFGISFDLACSVGGVDVDKFKARVLHILNTETYNVDWDRLADAPVGAVTLEGKDDNQRRNG